jgi:hypothetical protein
MEASPAVRLFAAVHPGLEDLASEGSLLFFFLLFDGGTCEGPVSQIIEIKELLDSSDIQAVRVATLVVTLTSHLFSCFVTFTFSLLFLGFLGFSQK